MSYRRTVEFLLHDWLEVETLRNRPRFAEHSRDTFDAVLDTCEKIAREKFAPYNRLADSILTLGRKMGEPYIAIPSPADVGVRHGLDVRATPPNAASAN